jgi:mRNA interferase MazF
MEFHQAHGGKVRPAVVLLDSGDDDFVAAPVTSAPVRCGFDVALGEWRQAGLNVESSIRTHKLTVLPKADIIRRLGALTVSDQRSLGIALQRVLLAE